MPTWFTQLPQWIQAIIVILGWLSALCTAFSGIFALCGWKKGVAACAAIGADIMKLLALLQGFMPANKPIEQVTQKEVKAQTMKNTLKTSLLLLSILTLAAFTSACATTKINVVSATSSDGLQWQFCVDVQESGVLGTTLLGMLCANDSALLAQLKTADATKNPTHTYSDVKQVPVK